MKALNLVFGSLVAIVSVACVVAQETGTDREAMVAQGREVFVRRCEYCHGEGPQKGGTMALQGRYQGAVPGILDERTNLTPEYIRQIVRTNTNGMSPIRITEVTELQLDALIAYLTRNN
jgi:mono/diheme cytochrome c family protein